MEICEGLTCGPLPEQELTVGSPLVGGAVGEDGPGRYIVISEDGLPITESMESLTMRARPLHTLANGKAIDVLSVRRNRTGSVVGLVEQPAPGWVVLAWSDGERLALHESQFHELRRYKQALERENSREIVDRRVQQMLEVEMLKQTEVENERHRLEIRREVDRQVKIELEKEWKEQAEERQVKKQQQAMREEQMKQELRQMAEQHKRELQQMGARESQLKSDVAEREKKLATLATEETQLKLELSKREQQIQKSSEGVPPGLAKIFGLNGGDNTEKKKIVRPQSVAAVQAPDAVDNARPCICVCQ